VLLVDFSAMAGHTLTVKNTNPRADRHPSAALSQAMQIRVAAGTSFAREAPSRITRPYARTRTEPPTGFHAPTAEVIRGSP
jgi:hypothetical protein